MRTLKLTSDASSLRNLILVVIIFIINPVIAFSQNAMKNFRTAVYTRVYEVQQMGDPEWLKSAWETIEPQLKVDKIYLETHRDLIIVQEDTLKRAIKFFRDRGIETAGGITFTVDESNRFETFCYTRPEMRAKVKEISEYTAKFFDEIILDDFFFTSCKCPACVNAKGDKSWTEYRLELMKHAAQDLVIEPAKKVNPNVKVVIKYPNWYEHFQGLGCNLEAQPKMFDGIYTGTETRDPSLSQHLQQYHGYLIYRYFDHLKPGGNGGGWVDTFASYYLDRYGEQLWLTLFSKAPEITLFDFRQMIWPLPEDSEKPAWQGTGTSFDYSEMIAPVKTKKGKEIQPSTLARAAGYTLEKIDPVIGMLGNPYGIKSYRPYHAVGEDFLQNYIGMLGVPMDIVPEFPVEEDMVFLTATAAYDPQIVEKIKKHLMEGKNITITSGLLQKLQERGLNDIAEIRYTDKKAFVQDFRIGYGNIVQSGKPMIIPQIKYLTNDSWEEISAFNGTNGWPILHSASYGKGLLYILTIPDNFVDMYAWPEEVLNTIKKVMCDNIPVRVEGPASVSLFVYDNNTFIVESFRDEEVSVKLVMDPGIGEIQNGITGEKLKGNERKPVVIRGRTSGENKQVFDVKIKPHSYMVFRYDD